MRLWPERGDGWRLRRRSVRCSRGNDGRRFPNPPTHACVGISAALPSRPRLRQKEVPRERPFDRRADQVAARSSGHRCRWALGRVRPGIHRAAAQGRRRSGGRRVPRVGDGPARRAASRAYNIVTAEYFRPFADRMTPAAIIPMHTPEEAIEELEYATRELGYKVAMLGSLMDRPVEAVGPVEGEAARFAVWKDVIGLDSEHDYDPVWAKCLELGIAPSFHSGARRSGLRLSPSNVTYNHIGHFAAANHAACKAMFLGGVTRRFPALRMAFLEGGSGWAAMLYGDLMGHWEKRSRKGLEEVDPRNLDRAVIMDLAQKYGGEAFVAALEERGGHPYPDDEKMTGGVADLDDYAACKITRKEDWRDLFVTPFYFGCEADDPSNVWAFNKKANPLGARLNAIFSSDIGHFDVPDMLGVLPEAYEMVEDELITPDDFRDFTFANVVRLFGAGNPRFFEGTRVAGEAAAVLGAT